MRGRTRVMEYIPGESLHELIWRSGGLPEDRAVHIASQVLQSLVEAHGHGVIHRDLKPSNVLIAQIRGAPDTVKVTDFGIAKALAPEMAHVQTFADEVIATPAYAAPELLLGQPITAAVDMYAMGLILLEMLVGRSPFAGRFGRRFGEQ